MYQQASPFNPDNEPAYQAWREAKLRHYPRTAADLRVTLSGADPTADELDRLYHLLDQCGMVIYRLPADSTVDKNFVRELGIRFGLHRLDGNLCADDDGITSLQVMETGRKGGYIPYSNKPLTWHSDGYYNDAEHQIRAVILHCVRPADRGGENLLLDHEMAYLQLRDESPALVRALMQADAMTIPPNLEGGGMVRGEVSGPVFSVDEGGRLHMRYSARTRNIRWKDDAETRAAVEKLKSIMDDKNPCVFKYRLQPGEGILSANVLHNRTGFEDRPDTPGRLLYRARYYDRIHKPTTNHHYALSE